MSRNSATQTEGTPYWIGALPFAVMASPVVAWVGFFALYRAHFAQGDPLTRWTIFWIAVVSMFGGAVLGALYAIERKDPKWLSVSILDAASFVLLLTGVLNSMSVSGHWC